jgi:hypothetical protein
VSGKKIAQIDDQQYISAPHYQGVNRYRTLHAAGGDDVDEGVIEEMEEDHQENVETDLDNYDKLMEQTTKTLKIIKDDQVSTAGVAFRRNPASSHPSLYA